MPESAKAFNMPKAASESSARPVNESGPKCLTKFSQALSESVNNEFNSSKPPLCLERATATSSDIVFKPLKFRSLFFWQDSSLGFL